jgi:hypothetical protein
VQFVIDMVVQASCALRRLAYACKTAQKSAT